MCMLARNAFEVEQDQVKTLAQARRGMQEPEKKTSFPQAIPEPVPGQGLARVQSPFAADPIFAPGTWPPTQEALNAAACSPSTVASTCEQAPPPLRLEAWHVGPRLAGDGS